MAGPQTTGKTRCTDWQSVLRTLRGATALAPLRQQNENRSLPEKPGFLYLALAVRVLCGGLLLAAAALKTHAWLTGAPAHQALLDSRWAFLGLIELELLLAMLLIFGPRGGRIALGTLVGALLFFGTAAGVSLSKALSGAESCGCFGAWPVHPWVTFLLDVAAVGGIALLAWGERADSSMPAVWAYPRRRVLLLIVLLSPAAAAAGIAQSRARLQADGTISGEGGTIVLHPATWLGQRFPLCSHVDLGDRACGGSCLLVLYGRSCSRCRRMIPEYRHQAATLHRLKPAVQVAFIEVPDKENSGQTGKAAFVPAGEGYATGRLDDGYRWFVETPVLLFIEDGLVRCVRGGPEAGELMEVVGLDATNGRRR